MKKRWIIFALILPAVFYPRFETPRISYQHFLWSSEWKKKAHPTPGFLFKFGETKEAQTWSRIRLGFPFGATTVDTKASKRVIQGRIETKALFLNILISAPLCFLGLILLSLARKFNRDQGTIPKELQD